jgi:hypothetical protein
VTQTIVEVFITDTSVTIMTQSLGSFERFFPRCIISKQTGPRKYRDDFVQLRRFYGLIHLKKWKVFFLQNSGTHNVAKRHFYVKESRAVQKKKVRLQSVVDPIA